MKANVSPVSAKKYGRIAYFLLLACCVAIGILLFTNWQTIKGIESITLMKMMERYSMFGFALMAIIGVSLQALMLIVMLVLYNKPSNSLVCFIAVLTFAGSIGFIIASFTSPLEVFANTETVVRVPSAAPYIVALLSAAECYLVITCNRLLNPKKTGGSAAPSAKASNSAKLADELSASVEQSKKK